MCSKNENYKVIPKETICAAFEVWKKNGAPITKEWCVIYNRAFARSGECNIGVINELLRKYGNLL